MRVAFMQSEEYRVRQPRRPLDQLYDGVDDTDGILLRRHLDPGAPEAGFVRNFLGTRMQAEFTLPTAGMSGFVYNDIPTVVGDYHAEPIEFVGLLKAVEAGSGPFVAVELGAGWGSWSVTAGHVARRCERGPIRLYAVEAGVARLDNIRQHYRNNGFDPAAHSIVNAAVGPVDGVALFPHVTADDLWGEQAIFLSSDDAAPQRPGYDVVPSITLGTLLASETLVDLVHFDIQGAERETIANAIEVLDAKVRYIVVGTHGRVIEGAIMDTLIAHGWWLENEQPARIRSSGNGREEILVDGTQVWRNPQIA
uniref:FkbM family methyltransferase n=1 Tax=uncultured Sphingomonas sp. TaxID=158754 RepID=UPI0035CC7346